MIGRGTSFFSVPALLISIHAPLFLPSSSIYLSYFILAVPMRKCLGKRSGMSSQFSIPILNGTLFFRSVKAMNNWKLSTIKQILLLLPIAIPNGIFFDPNGRRVASQKRTDYNNNNYYYFKEELLTSHRCFSHTSPAPVDAQKL